MKTQECKVGSTVTMPLSEYNALQSEVKELKKCGLKLTFFSFRGDSSTSYFTTDEEIASKLKGLHLKNMEVQAEGTLLRNRLKAQLDRKFSLKERIKILFTGTVGY